MSFNDSMHPRNPFKIKPNYQLLSEKYPSFKKYLIPYSLDNKFKINFNDPNALRCLSTILLKDKFNLDVNIPLNRLIPSIPQRLNYLLWLEDIIDGCFNNIDKVNLIDIGTGASCVFPLVGCSLKENWNFLATEIDNYSLECAIQNCESNQLNNRIKVIGGKKEQLIPDLEYEINFVALMCNPPFFELRNNQTTQSSANTSTLVESTYDGGEECFVIKLIEESLLNQNRIKLFTVMLGRKMSLKNLKKKLQIYKNDNLLNYIDTEFCQGKTIRWGLAWTFDLSFNLDPFKMKHLKKSSTILEYQIPETKFLYTYNLERVTEYVLEQLNSIMINKFNISNLIKSKYRIQFTIKTNTNTWSNQRRKRRQMKQMNKKLDNVNNDLLKDVDNQLMDELNDNLKKKRLIDELESSIDDFEEEIDFKKIKINDDNQNDEIYLLNCIVIIKQLKDILYLKMQSNDKVKDKDSVHQLFQFLKNKFLN